MAEKNELGATEHYADTNHIENEKVAHVTETNAASVALGE